ncbi:MAG: RluA family pseudouridine synthase [Candidatus Liptonbacteria bacterium]
MISPPIIYEDDAVIAINKPSGMLVHPYGAKGKMHGEGETVVDWLKSARPEIKNIGDMPDLRPGIVHRLDKDTSGVLLIAKTQKSFEYLKSLFAEKKIQKTYIAAVRGEFSEKKGVIDKPIGIRNGTVKRTVHGGRLVKPAITEYEVVREIEDVDGKIISVVKAMPKTGRTHQIRVHLASMGHPIIGDVLYGGKNEKGRQMLLHSQGIEFVSIDGKKLRIEAEPPEQLSTMLN